MLEKNAHYLLMSEIHSYCFWRAFGPLGEEGGERGHLALRQGTASPAPLLCE